MGKSVYGSRELVAVVPIPGVTWLYGFRTNYDKGDGATTLGHKPAFNGFGLHPLVVLGVNAPKPARVSRQRGAGSTDGLLAHGLESSFCSVEKMGDAQTAGWKVSRLYRRLLGKKGLFYVEIPLINPEIAADGTNSGGRIIKYAWPLPSFLREKITAADKTALGIVESKASDDNLVRGARYPKPPQAIFTAISTTGVGTRTTFVSPAKTDSLPSGWEALS